MTSPSLAQSTALAVRWLVVDIARVYRTTSIRAPAFSAPMLARR